MEVVERETGRHIRELVSGLNIVTLGEAEE